MLDSHCGFDLDLYLVISSATYLMDTFSKMNSKF